MGGFLFGFDAAVISGVIGFITPLFELNDWQIGLVVSAPTIAATLAALTVGPIADQVGRRKVMLTLALLYTISAVASAFAPDVITLIVARFIGGFAFGTLMLAPIYIGELSPARLRGRMVSVNQLNIVLGFSAAYFANYFLLQASQSTADWVSAVRLDVHAWRWMLGLEALPAAIYFFAMLVVPESPRWLILHGRKEEARVILEKITPPERIESKLVEIEGSKHDATESLRTRIGWLLRPELRLVLTVGFIVAIAQQITGINSLLFFAPTIFEQSGVGTNAAFAQATYVGIINVVFTIIAMLTIDRFGRRPLLILGLTGVAISMALASYGFHQARYELSPETAVSLAANHSIEGLDQIAGISFDSDREFKDAVGAIIGDLALKTNQATIIQSAIRIDPRIVLAGVLGFVASFALSLGPVMWVLFSEIFPNSIRGICMSAMGVVNSGVSFGVQFLFPWKLTNLGAATTFSIYAGFAVVGLVLVTWLLPETRGRTLEQLEVELTGVKPD